MMDNITIGGLILPIIFTIIGIALVIYEQKNDYVIQFYKPIFSILGGIIIAWSVWLTVIVFQ